MNFVYHNILCEGHSRRSNGAYFLKIKKRQKLPKNSKLFFYVIIVSVDALIALSDQLLYTFTIKIFLQFCANIRDSRN